MEIKLGSATNDRCDCGRYNISNEEEVMCHTCALIKRVCCVCQVSPMRARRAWIAHVRDASLQQPVDLDAEQEAVVDECETYEIPFPPGIFPLDFSWCASRGALVGVDC